jgi:HAD superfamily hydrolase (TIGR01509 family)
VAKLRGVLFDLDGTLVDVAGGTVRCVHAIAQSSGARRIEPAAIKLALRQTRSVRSKLAIWVADAITKHGGKPPSPRSIVRALGEVGQHVEPDLRAVRTIAHVARTHRVAIVTNGTRAIQRAKLRAAGLSDLVPAPRVIISGEMGVRKPDARIFREALRVTGEPPEATLFVGDDEHEDVSGARAVGMRTCRVAPMGTVTAADTTVEHVAELMDVIASES